MSYTAISGTQGYEGVRIMVRFPDGLERLVYDLRESDEGGKVLAGPGDRITNSERIAAVDCARAAIDWPETRAYYTRLPEDGYEVKPPRRMRVREVRAAWEEHRRRTCPDLP